MTGSQVTELQRDRAVDYLQQSYSTGVIDAEGFEERVAVALTATTRAGLNSSLRGIARVTGAPGNHSNAPMVRPQAVSGAENVGAGLNEFLFSFCCWFNNRGLQ